MNKTAGRQTARPVIALAGGSVAPAKRIVLQGRGVPFESGEFMLNPVGVLQ